MTRHWEEYDAREELLLAVRRMNSLSLSEEASGNYQDE